MSEASPKRRVAVLFGGRSAEHEISCISARSVIDALDPERNEVVAIGITKEGRWHLLPGPPALPAESGRMPEVTEDVGRTVELATEGAASELVTADGIREPIDVVFPVLHGPMGEDGAVQGMFELAGVPYVGAGRAGVRDRDGQGDAEGALHRRGPAGVALGGRARTGLGGGSRGCRRACGGPRLSRVREAGHARLLRGDLEGRPTTTTWRRRSPRRSATPERR